METRILPSRIQVLNRQRRYKIHRKSVASFCADLLQCLDQPPLTLSIVFVGPATIRALNRRFLKRDYATNVLSFSYDGVSMDRLPFLGEVVIAPESAVRQAARYGVHPEKELRKLLVHGILHLLGYDHQTDRGQMNRLQAKLLRRWHFVNAPSLADLEVNR